MKRTYLFAGLATMAFALSGCLDAMTGETPAAAPKDAPAEAAQTATETADAATPEKPDTTEMEKVDPAPKPAETAKPAAASSSAVLSYACPNTIADAEALCTSLGRSLKDAARGYSVMRVQTGSVPELDDNDLLVSLLIDDVTAEGLVGHLQWLDGATGKGSVGPKASAEVSTGLFLGRNKFGQFTRSLVEASKLPLR